MISKQTIKNNDELYEDIELIPLNLDAVRQRVDYFRMRTEECLSIRDYQKMEKYRQAFVFWEGIRDNHCVKESR